MKTSFAKSVAISASERKMLDRKRVNKVADDRDYNVARYANGEVDA